MSELEVRLRRLRLLSCFVRVDLELYDERVFEW